MSSEGFFFNILLVRFHELPTDETLGTEMKVL